MFSRLNSARVFRAFTPHGSFRPNSKGFIKSAQSCGRSFSTASANMMNSNLGQIGGFVVFVGMSGYMVHLGTWQLNRRINKISMIADREVLMAGDPMPLLDYIDKNKGNKAEKLELGKVSMTGKFDYSRQYQIGPRQLSKGPGLGSGGSATVGFFLITPLVLETGGEVLVNRGFVTRNSLQGTGKVRETAGDETVEIIGITANGEKRNVLTKAWMPKEGEEQWPYLFLPLLQEKTRLKSVWPEREFIVDCFESKVSGGSTTPLINRKDASQYTSFPTSPLTHLAYAGTWYGCAAACMGIAAVRFRPAFAANAVAKVTKKV